MDCCVIFSRGDAFHTRKQLGSGIFVSSVFSQYWAPLRKEASGTACPFHQFLRPAESLGLYVSYPLPLKWQHSFILFLPVCFFVWIIVSYGNMQWILGNTHGKLYGIKQQTLPNIHRHKLYISGAWWRILGGQGSDQNLRNNFFWPGASAEQRQLLWHIRSNWYWRLPSRDEDRTPSCPLSPFCQKCYTLMPLVTDQTQTWKPLSLKEWMLPLPCRRNVHAF